MGFYIHLEYSDGQWPQMEIINKTKRKVKPIITISDHDAIDGYYIERIML